MTEEVMRSNLAKDVLEAVEGMQRIIDTLHSKYPTEKLLLLHIAYNWRVAQLLKGTRYGD